MSEQTPMTPDQAYQLLHDEVSANEFFEKIAELDPKLLPRTQEEAQQLLEIGTTLLQQETEKTAAAGGRFGGALSALGLSKQASAAANQEQIVRCYAAHPLAATAVLTIHQDTLKKQQPAA